jgi:FimV-like protein
MLPTKQISFRKFLGLLSIILAGTISFSVSAFTLGDIRLESLLNQPLQASIQLSELDGLNNSQILVVLGSQADFERVGVELSPSLNNLDFDVEVYSAAEGAIIISSDVAIVEPYLNFVLNVRWPSGQVIREFEVQLDLPTLSLNPVPATAPLPPQSSNLAETVIIKQGDTLWEIALATRPNNAISVQQMMLAIQRVNADSDAFINNNINGIRAGRVLRIPDNQEMAVITQEQAIIEVALQNQQFRGAQPLAINNAQRTTAVSGDELSIINGSDTIPAEMQQISTLNDTISALEAELSLSEESLNAARMENEELRSRLADLEMQIELLENIIAIEDQRMAELQAQLADQLESAVLTVNDTQNPQEALPLMSQARLDYSSKITNFISSIVGLSFILGILLVFMVGFLVFRNRQSEQNAKDFISLDKIDNLGTDFLMHQPEKEAAPEDIVQGSELAEDSLNAEYKDDFNSDPNEGFVAESHDDVPVRSKSGSVLGKLGVADSLLDDDSDEEELEMITDHDEVSTKLDLAVVYKAMKNLDAAREILDEVIAEGNEEQIAEAKKLLDELDNA